jgi:hypothetical protein
MVILNSNGDPKSLKMTYSQGLEIIKLGFHQDPITMNKLLTQY